MIALILIISWLLAIFPTYRIWKALVKEFNHDFYLTEWSIGIELGNRLFGMALAIVTGPVGLVIISFFYFLICGYKFKWVQRLMAYLDQEASW